MNFRALALLEKNKEALELFRDDMSGKEVAAKLGINKRTLDGRISQMLAATGKRRVAGLVVYAVKNKIINLV